MKVKKHLLMLLMLGMVAALPGTAMGQIIGWSGAAGGDFATATNWTLPPDTNGFDTEYYQIDTGDAPLKGAGYTGWGYARIKNGGIINQADGTHEWANGTGATNWGLALFGAPTSVLHMTGGTHIADRLGVGMDNSGNIKPTGRVDIWNDSVFQIRANPFVTPDLFDLFVGDGSLIDIRDLGEFHVPLGLQAKVDGYIGTGNIVAGNPNQTLFAATVNGEYVVSAIPEPASLLLLGLGLGSLALIRRKRV